MNLQQLYYFRKIAEIEHYTKAAKVLCISQPSLSYAISELEKELGAPLFYKTGRNIKLTRYGEIFLTHVNKSLNELEIAKNKIADLVSPNTGNVIISHISSTNVVYVPFLIRKFYEISNNKTIKLDFIENPTQKIVESLKARKVDVGFGSKIDDEELIFYPLFKEDLILIVPKNHPLSCRDEIELKDTIKYDYIAYSKNCGIRYFIDKIFSDSGLTRTIVREVEDNTMITGMVSSGLGIAVVPRIFGHEYYNVKPIEMTEINSERYVYMMWLKDVQLSAVTGKFIEFVKELADSTRAEI